MKRKIIGISLGAALITTVFYSSTSASAAEVHSKSMKVINNQEEEVRPQAVGKWVLAGGKFIAKQLTSAWAADQWSTASTKKEYNLDKDELEVLFDH